ncbi:MAG: DNA repair protein RadC [Gammaproteobacteria bacterium]|nr:DNA repair protein RadC [Gammaproteobacteria bacterium]
MRESTDTSSLTDAELLVILLRGCGRPTQRLTHRLLSGFGGLRALLHADPERLMAENGIGPAGSAALQALPELARRYFAESLPVGRSIRCPADTQAFLRAKIRHLGHELFCCLYLDNRHRVLRFDELFRGTIDGTSVYPREVVKEALAINAAAVILAHNHPSGVAEPSQADERITRRLKAALELVDIRLLDHFIIGDAETTSLASRGLL